jgi:hypothetical protein
MFTAQSGFEWAPPEVAHLWPRPGHKGAAHRNHEQLCSMSSVFLSYRRLPRSLIFHHGI